MPELNKNRKRPITLMFRVSSNEAKQINERIAISGLPRGKYFIKTFLEQEITMKGGKFESDFKTRITADVPRYQPVVPELVVGALFAVRLPPAGWRRW